jgi:hypothetical protein
MGEQAQSIVKKLKNFEKNQARWTLEGVEPC